jgi:hypothetical protein
LLGNGHGASKGHHHKTLLIAGHRFQHVGSFSDLAASESGFRHGAHQTVNGADFAEVERLQRDELILNRIVQLALDPRAIVIAMFQSFVSWFIFA